jgi:hypothetical protein
MNEGTIVIGPHATVTFIIHVQILQDNSKTRGCSEQILPIRPRDGEDIELLVYLNSLPYLRQSLSDARMAIMWRPFLLVNSLLASLHRFCMAQI